MQKLISLLLAACLLCALPALSTGCAARIEPVSSRTIEDDLGGADEDGEDERPAGPEAPQEAGESFGAPPSKDPGEDANTPAQEAPPADEAPAEPDQPPAPPSGEVSSQPQGEIQAELYAEQGQYPVDTESVRVFILNKGTSDLGYDAYYTLEQLQGESWQEVSAEEGTSFEDWAGILPPGKETSVPTDLTAFAGKLQAGSYRIVKKLDGQTFYAPFELV